MSKNLTTGILVVLAAIAGFVFVYVFCAYGAWNINPAGWTEEGRALAAVTSAMCSLVAGGSVVAVRNAP